MRVEAPLDSGDLLRVRAVGAEVDGVGTRVGAAGLEEVHVRVDEAGHHPAPASVDDAQALGQRHLRPGSDRLDPLAFDDDDRIRPRRSARAVEDGRADDGESLGRARRRRHRGRDERTHQERARDDRGRPLRCAHRRARCRRRRGRNPERAGRG